MKKSNIPSPVAPFIDVRSGNISREWFYFLNNYVFEKLGGGGNETTIPDIETDIDGAIDRIAASEQDINAIEAVNAAQSALIDGLRDDVDDNTADITTLQSTKEDVANKVSSWSTPTTDTNYPSEKLVRDTIGLLEPATYYPASLTVSAGTLDTGTYSDLAALGGTDVNVSEAVGASPLIVTLGFTGVTKLSGFVFFGHYVGGAGHQVSIEAYNYTLASWDQIEVIGTDSAKRWYAAPFFSPSDYISAGEAQIRFSHVQNGINTHDLILDMAALYFGALSGQSNISAAAVSFTPTGNIAATNVGAALIELDSEKQETLSSGVNIKTINSTSILGSGDIAISGSGLSYSQVLSLVSMRV